jgi:hypothetical protein
VVATAAAAMVAATKQAVATEQAVAEPVGLICTGLHCQSCQRSSGLLACSMQAVLVCASARPVDVRAVYQSTDQYM